MKLHLDKQIDEIVRGLPSKIPKPEMISLFQRLEEECRRQHVEYEKEDGSLRLINVMPTPRLLTLAQRAYLNKITATMNQAFFKIGPMYSSCPGVRLLLPFPEQEAAWIQEFLPVVLKQKGEVVSRWDAVCDFSRNGKLSTLHFVENNAVGIGGIYYIPTTERVIWKAVVPSLRRWMPGTRFHLNPNLQGLLARALRRHAARIGVKKPRIGLVVDCLFPGGPMEFPHLAEYLRAEGLQAKVCDARQLKLRNGKIFFRDFQIDLIYRDTELAEFLEYEKEGHNMAPIRQAFAENRVVSSILGEFDHKSLLEIYTSPEYARHFTAAERAIFRRHALWTRLLTDRRTTAPDGKNIELLKFVRTHKNRLVIKPNKMFGGEGVVLGKNLSLREWDKHLARAAQYPGDWVVQQQAEIVSKPYLTRKKNKISVENFNFVLGLAPVAGGLGILGRASRKEVVNVARLGGLAAVLVTS